MTRLPPCQWVGRDADGRPRCEHGWAHRNGRDGNRQLWRCPEHAAVKLRRFRATEAGRAARARENRSESARLSKTLYALTYIRVN